MKIPSSSQLNCYLSLEDMMPIYNFINSNRYCLVSRKCHEPRAIAVSKEAFDPNGLYDMVYVEDMRDVVFYEITSNSFLVDFFRNVKTIELYLSSPHLDGLVPPSRVYFKGGLYDESKNYIEPPQYVYQFYLKLCGWIKRHLLSTCKMKGKRISHHLVGKENLRFT